METKHTKRGHTDEQISQWVDREGKIDLDRLTEADIAKAAEVVSVNRWLKNIRLKALQEVFENKKTQRRTRRV